MTTLVVLPEAIYGRAQQLRSGVFANQAAIVQLGAVRGAHLAEDTWRRRGIWVLN